MPFDHGRWLAQHVPGAEARLLDGEGHLTLLSRGIPVVHEWLAARL